LELELINPEMVMQQCIAKAIEFKGKTKRNPTVGAAIVRDGEILDIDGHRLYGENHAEVNVLQKVGEMARNADLYVTLEPCSSYGKTPPCTKTIIDAGIKRVFIGVVDPNPINSGKGIKDLRDGNIEVYLGFNKEACARLIEDFTKSILKKRTYNILKVAQSLDGKIATKKGDSRYITNTSSREYVHYIRSTCDGILVGINTVLQDDPRLDVRLKGDENVGPKKIVLDTYLKIEENCNLISFYAKDLIIFTGKKTSQHKRDRLLQKGVSIYECNVGEKGIIDPKEISEKLLELNILRVLIEGGAKVHGNFLDNEEIDYSYFFFAPIIIGGESSISSIGGVGVSLVKNAHKLNNLLFRRFENDLLIEGKLNDYTYYVLEKTENISKLCSQV
jgi:diaminohydroxyphosphoribosylaminopyrimidine deaminase/5-amino-6-(5-phosphoribosylamino)uracil reductase